MDISHATETLFEMSRPGRRSTLLPACDVPKSDLSKLQSSGMLAKEKPGLPEVSELEIVRHYVNLSNRNMAIDRNFYPLGSCTMKYNPKRNERVAGHTGFMNVHPYRIDDALQGLLHLLSELHDYLCEISGLPCCSLQPAAGAQGELTALLCAAAYFRDRKENRSIVLIPDSAHGTNPASAALAGFETITIKSDANGLVDINDFKSKLDDRIAVFMMTNPNTVGIFDPQIGEIASMVHKLGGLVYMDGANMNAILGQTRPGDFGIDMMHYNPHKTFSGPHGGGGPGAGPICVREFLEPFLPTPTVAKRQKSDSKTEYYLEYNRPKSIGRVRSFFGNVGVLVRAYAYIRTYGPDGLKAVAQNAVLNANYLLSLLNDVMPVPFGNRCMHEFVASGKEALANRGVRTMDIAKRLLDYGYHAPTIYFPLIVPEAFMVEPTETETKETLEQFAQTLRTILNEPAETLKSAPNSTAISRPDEVRAARQPVLRCAKVATS